LEHVMPWHCFFQVMLGISRLVSWSVVIHRLKISALILTDWLADRKELTLEDLAEAFTTSFKDWLETKKTRVSYDLVVDVARDSIREIAGYLRQSLIAEACFR